MARAPFGHVSRHCVRCGTVGPRTMFDGGWAHARCLTPQERKAAHRVALEIMMRPSDDADSPTSVFMRRAPSAIPRDVGSALGARGNAMVSLHSLVVEPAKRRKGFARAALHQLCKLADETGTTLTAEVWPREKGPGAIAEDALVALFHANGFLSDGAGKGMRREPRRR